MIHVQIAVTIANSVFTHPSCAETGIAAIKFHRKVPNGRKSGPRDRTSDKFFCLPEVFVGADPQFLDASPSRDRRRWSLRLVELSQRRDNSVHLGTADLFEPDQPGKEIARIEFLHLNCILHGRAAIGERQFPIVHEDWQNSQMNV